MKKYFITGIIILLPLALTLAIISFIMNVLTDPFIGMMKGILGHYNMFATGFLFFSADQMIQFFSQLIILVLIFVSAVGLGWVAHSFFTKYVIKFWEKLFSRIPFFSSIYKACRDVIHALFKSNTSSFKQVVLVPFPSSASLVIGFVTNDLPLHDDKTDPDDIFVAVFIPTTPNPTGGYLTIFHNSDVINIDIKVEDAFKYIVSCGVLPSPFTSSTMNEVAKKLIRHKKKLILHKQKLIRRKKISRPTPTKDA